MEAEDSGEMGDTTGASAMDQDEKTADETLRATKKEVDDAFEILVRNATEEFGFAPRDVYNGVFFLRKTKWDHATALGGLKYPDLLALVGDFSKDMKLDDTSHRVVAVFPRAGGTDDYSLWEMAFKSVRIAREVILLMRLKEDDYLRQTYNYLHGSSKGSTLAGWVFKAIVHRAFARGWSDGFAPQCIPMHSGKKKKGSPLFSTDPPSTPDASSSSLALRTHTRDVVLVDFASGLDNVTLDDNKYYVPTGASNPLFDSFTINQDQGTAVICIFRITISPEHEGSARGYLSIRKIMAHVHKLLKPRKPNFKIAYILVCPEGISQHKWHMPVGWNEGTRFYNHQGNAYCLRIPVSVRRDTSRLLTPNFATWLNHGWI